MTDTIQKVHDGDTPTLENDVSPTRVATLSSHELGTPEGDQQAESAQVIKGLPVRKNFLNKDFANRDVSDLFIQTPKGEVNYSTLAKTMGWGEDDSSYGNKGEQDTKAFWTGKESFDQKDPEQVSTVEIAKAESLIKNYKDKEAVYMAGGMQKEQYLELLGDTMTGDNHDLIMKYMTYKNQSGKSIEPDPVIREKKRISNLTRTGHGRVSGSEDDSWSDFGRGLINIVRGDVVGDDVSNVEAVNQDLNPNYNVRLAGAYAKAKQDKTKLDVNWPDLTESLSQEDKEKVELARYESDGYALMTYRDIKNFNDRQSKAKDLGLVHSFGLMAVGTGLNPSNILLGEVAGAAVKGVGVGTGLVLNKLGVPVEAAMSHGLVNTGTGILSGAGTGAGFMAEAGAIEGIQSHQTLDNLKEEAEMGALFGGGFHIAGMGAKASWRRFIIKPRETKQIELNRLQDEEGRRTAEKTQLEQDKIDLQSKRLEMETRLADQAKLKDAIKNRMDKYGKKPVMIENDAKAQYEHEKGQDWYENAQNGQTGTDAADGRFPTFDEWMKVNNIELGVDKSTYNEWNRPVSMKEVAKLEEQLQAKPELANNVNFMTNLESRRKRIKRGNLETKEVNDVPYSSRPESENPGMLLSEVTKLEEKLKNDQRLKSNEMFMHNLEVAKGKLDKSLGRKPDGKLAVKLGTNTNAEAVEKLRENPDIPIPPELEGKTVEEMAKPDKTDYVPVTEKLIEESKPLTDTPSAEFEHPEDEPLLPHNPDLDLHDSYNGTSQLSRSQHEGIFINGDGPTWEYMHHNNWEGSTPDSKYKYTQETSDMEDIAMNEWVESSMRSPNLDYELADISWRGSKARETWLNTDEGKKFLQLRQEAGLKNAKQTRGDIKTFAGDNEHYSELFEEGTKQGIKVNEQAQVSNQSGAIYNPNTHTISVGTFLNVSDSRAHAIAHETIHGIVTSIRNVPELWKDVTNLAVKVRDALLKDPSSPKLAQINEAVSDGHFASEEIEEIITYSYSHPEFHNWLSEQPGKVTTHTRNSMWNRLHKSSTQNSLLDELTEIMNTYAPINMREAVRIKTPEKDVVIDIPPENQVLIDLAPKTEVVELADQIKENNVQVIDSIEKAFESKESWDYPEKHLEDDMINEAMDAYDRTPEGKRGDDMLDSWIDDWMITDEANQIQGKLLFENRQLDDPKVDLNQTKIEAEEQLKELAAKRDKLKEVYDNLNETQSGSKDDEFAARDAYANFKSAQTNHAKYARESEVIREKTNPNNKWERTLDAETVHKLEGLDLPDGKYDILPEHLNSQFAPGSKGASKLRRELIKQPGMENVKLIEVEIAGSEINIGGKKSVRLVVDLLNGDNPREIRLKQAAGNAAKEELPNLNDQLDSMTEAEIKRDCGG